MADIPATTTDSVPRLIRKWSGVGQDDTLVGDVIELDNYVPTMIGLQVNGTFGGSAAVKLQGTIDGATWFDLEDVKAEAANLTAAGFKHVPAVPVRAVRPVFSGGDGSTSLAVAVAVFRS